MTGIIIRRRGSLSGSSNQRLLNPSLGSQVHRLVFLEGGMGNGEVGGLGMDR